MLKTVQIKVPIYDVFVTFCTERELAKAFCKKNGIVIEEDIIDKDCGFLYFQDGQFFICVFNREFATLSHECLHCAIEILHWVKVPLDYEMQETIAYLMEYLIKKFLPIMEKDKEDDDSRKAEPKQSAKKK